MSRTTHSYPSLARTRTLYLRLRKTLDIWHLPMILGAEPLYTMDLITGSSGLVKKG